jgi:hypothetical protein
MPHGEHMSASESEKHKQIAVQVASKLGARQRAVVSDWITQMLALKATELGGIEKAKQAIALTANSTLLTAAVQIIGDAITPSELRALTAELVKINESSLALPSKVTQGTTLIAKSLKTAAWDKRGLPARLALSAAIAGVLFFGGQGAGIAALGSAIGLPLWVVFGAGGAFLGVLYEEITGKKPDAKTTYRVIDAEREEKE